MRRTVVVTGANGVIGKAIARRLAETQEFTLVLACRDGPRGQQALPGITGRYFAQQSESACPFGADSRAVASLMEACEKIDREVRGRTFLQRRYSSLSAFPW